MILLDSRVAAMLKTTRKMERWERNSWCVLWYTSWPPKEERVRSESDREREREQETERGEERARERERDGPGRRESKGKDAENTIPMEVERRTKVPCREREVVRGRPLFDLYALSGGPVACKAAERI